MGRPIEYTAEVKAAIVDRINEYTAMTDIPILKEFCYQNNIPHTHIYDHKEFSEPIAKLLAKKESQLERQGLDGEVNTVMAKFSLYQLGWTERRRIEANIHKEDRAFDWADEPDNPED